MAHEFESGFFVEQPAWHQLGTVLHNPPTTAQGIVEAGLDWRVLEEPVYRVEENQPEAILQKKLIRDRDRTVLGIVKPNYTPLQNQDAFHWFDPLLETGGVQLEAAGSLKNGQRIWILAKLPKMEAEIIKGDWVRPYLLLHNSHDGSTAVWLQFTFIRVVCWNTLNGATANRFNDLRQQKAICIPHTADLPQQLAKVRNILDLAKHQFELSVEEYKAMANTEIKTDFLAQYYGRVLGISRQSSSQQWSQLVANFESGRGNQGKTLWDAYNSITEWIDHQQQELAADRLESSWFGDGTGLRHIAHRIALSMTKSSGEKFHRPRIGAQIPIEYSSFEQASLSAQPLVRL